MKEEKMLELLKYLDQRYEYKVIKELQDKVTENGDNAISLAVKYDLNKACVNLMKNGSPATSEHRTVYYDSVAIGNPNQIITKSKTHTTTIPGDKHIYFDLFKRNNDGLSAILMAEEKANEHILNQMFHEIKNVGIKGIDSSDVENIISKEINKLSKDTNVAWRICEIADRKQQRFDAIDVSNTNVLKLSEMIAQQILTNHILPEGEFELKGDNEYSEDLINIFKTLIFTENKKQLAFFMVEITKKSNIPPTHKLILQRLILMNNPTINKEQLKELADFKNYLNYFNDEVIKMNYKKSYPKSLVVNVEEMRKNIVIDYEELRKDCKYYPQTRKDRYCDNRFAFGSIFEEVENLYIINDNDINTIINKPSSIIEAYSGKSVTNVLDEVAKTNPLTQQSIIAAINNPYLDESKSKTRVGNLVSCGLDFSKITDINIINSLDKNQILEIIKNSKEDNFPEEFLNKVCHTYFKRSEAGYLSSIFNFLLNCNVNNPVYFYNNFINESFEICDSMNMEDSFLLASKFREQIKAREQQEQENIGMHK
jgi:hypothetical protein